MQSKDDLIKKLRNNSMYRDALKLAKTEADRRKIIATAEGFISNFFDSLHPVAKKIEEDSSYRESFLKEVTSQTSVIKERDGSIETSVSGSK